MGARVGAADVSLAVRARVMPPGAAAANSATLAKPVALAGRAALAGPAALAGRADLVARADSAHPAGLVDPDGPVVSGEDVLPVLPALHGLLAAGGLRRGHVVATAGEGLLVLALAAAASAAGAWCAVVGLPSLGVRAAVEVGLDPGQLLLVAQPGENWPQVVASLLDGCDVVLLRPPARPAAQLRRKLEAAARRFGSVLLVAGEWEGAAARLLIADQQWAGIGAGHGRLRARRAQIVAEGRGAGVRARSAWVWLPGPDGAIRAAPDHVMTQETVLAWDAGTARDRWLARNAGPARPGLLPAAAAFSGDPLTGTG
jgi:hypothetical protein